MFGLPGGSNGGLPMGPIAFWFLILLTIVIVVGFVMLMIYAVNQIEAEPAKEFVLWNVSAYLPGSNLPTGYPAV